jgi:hypothetical protein
MGPRNAPTDASDTRIDRQPQASHGSGGSRGRALTLLRRLRDRVSDDSGQSLILVMIFMVVIVAVAALAIDAGEMGSAHHRAQLAADASALSAAQDMETPGYTNATVTTNATTIAKGNLSNSNVAITQPDPNTATAKVSAPVGLTFGGFFGLGSSAVSATATAQLSSTQAAIGDGDVSSLGCNGSSQTTNCSYGANTVIPGASGTDGTNDWAVTAYPENDSSKTCGGNPGNGVLNDSFPCGTPNDWSGNNPNTAYDSENQSSATSQVNLQDCGGGTSGAGTCYPPGTTAATAIPVNAIPGTEVVDLNGEGEGGMWETVQTVPGARYVLSFELTGNPALGAYTTFYMDTQVTNGTAQYTPNVAYPNTESNANVIASKVYWVSDPTWNGSLAALFQDESITFTALSSETTITFNSEQSDNDAYDASYGGGYFNCGPEVTDIHMNYPAIVLTQ